MSVSYCEATVNEAEVDIDQFSITFRCKEGEEAGLCTEVEQVVLFDHSTGMLMEEVKPPPHIFAEAKNLALQKINEERRKDKNNAV